MLKLPSGVQNVSVRSSGIFLGSEIEASVRSGENRMRMRVLVRLFSESQGSLRFWNQAVSILQGQEAPKRRERPEETKQGMAEKAERSAGRR